MLKAIQKHLFVTCSIILAIFTVFGFFFNFASALEYSSSANIKFILNPTLTITTDGDMLMVVAPGNKVLSENSVEVTTNNPTGYTLSADVGCTSGTDCYDNRTLSNGTSGFNIVSSTTALSPNTWGYTTDDSATTSSNFGPLPLHDTTPLVLNQTSDASGTAVSPYLGTSTTPFLVGAYASSTMLAGTYKNTVNFYAVANPMPNYMQEADAVILNELMPNVGDYAILLDKRDSTPYTIGKLEDGNYWMLDNLAIDLTTVSLATLKGQTNASDTSLEYLKNGGGTTSDQYAESAVSDDWRYYMKIPDIDFSYVDPRIDLLYIDTVGVSSTQYGNGSHKYGVYYNFCAATAGSYCYGTSVGDATEDICPAGWRMPTGGATGEYKALCDAILGSSCSQSQSMTGTSSTSLQYKLSTPLSGYLSSTGNSWGRYQQGSSGYFWSSTRASSSGMYYLNVGHSSASTINNTWERYRGISVRCLFKQ